MISDSNESGLALDDQCSNRCYEEESKDCNAVEIKFAREFKRSEFVLGEALVSGASEMSRNSRMRSGRFAGTHIVQIWNAHPFKFIGMNASSVISTRSGGGPSVNLSLPDVYVHGVSSLDRVDISPTDGVLVNGIGYNDALVVKSHFGSNEEQVSDTANEGTDCESRNSRLKFGAIEIRTRHSHTKSEYSNPVEDVAARPKNFRVLHGESFSWNWSAA